MTTELRQHRTPTLELRDILRTATHVAGAATAATLGGVVVTTTSGCRCGQQESFDYEAWAETDGAAGRINMEAVQQAFAQATDPTDFEARINRIYEGYHPVVIRVHTQGQEQLVEGWEDLNDSATIDEASDDKLFTLRRPLSGQGQVTLQGHGANTYYSSHFPMAHLAGGFFTGYLMGSLLSRPYLTPPARVTTIRQNVRSYRQSAAFSQQRAANRSFFSSQRATNPHFGATSRNVSPARQSFRSSVRSSGGSFRSSLSGPSGVRSGFRGGGR